MIPNLIHTAAASVSVDVSARRHMCENAQIIRIPHVSCPISVHLDLVQIHARNTVPVALTVQPAVKTVIRLALAQRGVSKGATAGNHTSSGMTTPNLIASCLSAAIVSKRFAGCRFRARSSCASTGPPRM